MLITDVTVGAATGAAGAGAATTADGARATLAVVTFVATAFLDLGLRCLVAASAVPAGIRASARTAAARRRRWEAVEFTSQVIGTKAATPQPAALRFLNSPAATVLCVPRPVLVGASLRPGLPPKGPVVHAPPLAVARPDDRADRVRVAAHRGERRAFSPDRPATPERRSA